MKFLRSKISWLLSFFKSRAQYSRFRKLAPDQKNIVFYSESKHDWHHFKPIINYLTYELSRTVCYISSDLNDFGLKQKNEKLLPFFIKEGFWQILLFQMLKADVLALTILDLNNLQLKRSIHPVHYIYIFHAMGSTHMVDFENSYDHYDSIFCVGPHQMKEIQKRETLKNLPPKHLFEHGYSRLEALMTRRDKKPKISEQPVTVLVAPTWGERSILNECGERLVEILLNAGYRVMLRPHYQTLKLTPEVVTNILDKFGDHHNLEYIELMGESDSLLVSDILICDWSSMAIEYALALEKPVLFIDVPRRVRNPNYQELGIEPIEVSIRWEIGAILNPTDLDKAPSHIDRLLADPKQFRQKIAALRERLVFNLGCSAEVAALEIARIADEKAQQRRKAANEPAK